MAAPMTPVSKHDFSCFSCLTSGLATYIRRNGRKSTSDNLNGILERLLGIELCRKLPVDSPLCRSCYTTFLNAEQFISDARNATRRYTTENSQSKRLMELTPQGQVDRTRPTTQKAKSRRKSLNMNTSNSENQQPTIHQQPTINQQQSESIGDKAAHNITASYSDHQYSDPSRSKGKPTSNYFVIPEPEPIKTSDQFLSKNVDIVFLENAIASRRFHELFDYLLQNMYTCNVILQKMSNKIDMESTVLSSRNAMSASVLQRDLNSLNVENLIRDLYSELKARLPLLYVFLVAAARGKKSIGFEHVGPLVLAYSVLVFTRNNKMNALQRVLTCVLTEGHSNSMLSVLFMFNFEQSSFTEIQASKRRHTS